jgi:hypothetical protein
MLTSPLTRREFLGSAAVAGGWLVFGPRSARCAAHTVEGDGMKLEPFDYRGVTLDAGPLRRQFDQVREFYRRIPNDDLLKGVRARAGRPAPGVELGGWYSRDNGNIFGQVVSALSRMYAATEDEACRDKAAALVEEWGRCLGSDGYGFYSHKTTGKVYTFDKLVAGLVDASVYGHIEAAAPLLRRFVDWGEKNLDRGRLYANADGEGSPNVAGSEWYTLPENLYRAFLATGDARYRDFAELWEYTQFWDLLARKADIFAPRADGQRTEQYHAYSHVNSLSSAAAAYLVKRDQRYLDTLVGAYEFLQTQMFATGGYGPRESLMPVDRIPAELREAGNHFETQCGSWAGFKLAKYLIRFTGDARYGDWIERLIYNGIGASLPITDDGRVFYYSSYKIDGACKTPYGDGWSCCSGTHPLAVADFHDLIYFHGDNELAVNLYTSSTVDWMCGKTPVTLRQFTHFPDEDTLLIAVVAARPAEFTLRLRVPGWLAGPMPVEVNGTPLAGTPDAKHWVSIRRIWQSSDTLRVKFPQRLTSCPIAAVAAELNSAVPHPAAIMRGPVVLAVRSPEGPPHRRIDLAHLDDELVPSPGEALTYHVKHAAHRVPATEEGAGSADPTLLVRPFYTYREGEQYFMYLDPAAGE